MKELLQEEAQFVSGGHEPGEQCDHDHHHDEQDKYQGVRAYHFDFSDWF